MTLIVHGFDDATERRLYSLSLSATADVPKRLELSSRHFVCLLAWDARDASNETVARVADRLLSAGASYFVCWGPDCERVHDIIDEIAERPAADFALPEDSCIMTTWHDSEPLDEAIWFFLASAWPDEPYFETTRSSLAISIGSHEWSAAISAALGDVREFVRRRSAN
jgi:hypothetical protein